MAQSTNVAKYPEGLLDIIEAICTTRQPCDIVYDTYKRAQAERFKFYGLIKALLISGHSLGHVASRITTEIYGQDPKAPNILRLKFAEKDENDDFYKAIAEKHIRDHSAEIKQ